MRADVSRAEYEVEVVADAVPRTAQLVRWGPCESVDPMWAGVVVSPSSFEVSSVLRGTISASASSLSVLIGGETFFDIFTSSLPTADVRVPITVPVGFTLKGGSPVVIPAQGSSVRVALVAAADGTLRDPGQVTLGLSSSDDIQFTGVQVQNVTVEIMSQ
jgi:hypothetical protein